MRILSLLLSFCITFNVLAASGTVAELEKHIDEYQYVLTVEWDQKDQAFYQAQTDAFLEKLSELIKTKGLTKEQILEISEKRVKDKAAFEALKLKMSLLDKNTSADQLAKVLSESSKDFYSRGASWSGDAAFIIPLALAGIIIGYAIWFHITHECVAYEERYSCSTDQYCASYSYDWQGYSYCDYYREETDCGWDTVCARYEKKKK
jgi:hypothetical protein